VRQLLTHTAGLFGYARRPDYLLAVASEPRRRWSRLDQVRLAVEHGAPVGAPGERFSYSHTGDIPLG
jgi:D-alanyl-D-alanine carboxypeptidase